jgi:hypothetical protein
MDRVASTGGCQSIIHHWARFMEWNNDKFYSFIQEALGPVPPGKKVTDEKGDPTWYGRRRRWWRDARRRPDKLRRDLADLKGIDFQEKAVREAKKYLPPEAVLDADFYFVLFGHSNAFSVGRENGFDFLQLPRTPEGRIDRAQLIRVLTHELHHSGFASLNQRVLAGVSDQEKILLPGILAAEGSATHFVDRPADHLGRYQIHHDSAYREVAADWEKHTARLPQLYRLAERDIAANLKGDLDQKGVISRWMSGAKGPAYVLGADMVGTIERYSGRADAVSLARDYRRLLLLYNEAARRAAQQGKTLFIFDQKLAQRLAAYR